MRVKTVISIVLSSLFVFTSIPFTGITTKADTTETSEKSTTANGSVTTATGPAVNVDAGTSDSTEKDENHDLTQFEYNGLTFEVYSVNQWDADSDKFIQNKYVYVSGVTDSSLIDITIPDTAEDIYGNKYTVKGIRYSSFSGNKILKSIKIPSTVTEIGNGAFYGCKSLDSIELPDSIKEIGRDAFENSGLKSVKIDGNVKTIREYTFEDCVDLASVTISAGLKEIGESAFLGCTNLDSVTIPSTVYQIDANAFKDCEKLSTINYSGTQDSWKKITIISAGNNILNKATITYGTDSTDDEHDVSQFEYNGLTFEVYSVNQWDADSDKFIQNKYVYVSGVTDSSLIDITIPDTAEDIYGNKYTVKGIRYSSFSGNKILKSIKIPSTVTEIGNGAFYGCKSLDSIELPDSIKEIGRDAFENSGLKSVKIDGNVKTIREYTFEDCVDLASVTISAGLKEIGESAFSGCSSLDSITIPFTVDQIDANAFKACDKLTTVYFTGTETQWDEITIISAGNSALSDVEVKYGSTDQTIANDVMDDIFDIGNVTLGSGEEIADARAHYENLTDEQKALVTNLKILEESESKYKELVEKNNKDRAENVIWLINNIGEVTRGSSYSINRARKAYDALTPDQKNLVTNYSTLTTAEEKYKEIKSNQSASGDASHSSGGGSTSGENVSGGGNSSGNTSGGTSGSGNTSGETPITPSTGDDTKVPDTPSDGGNTKAPEKPVISDTKVKATSGDDGVYRTENGDIAKNTLVSTTNDDGKKVTVITDADGKAYKNAIITTETGKNYAAKSDGSIAVNESVKIDGKKYVASKDGTLYKKGLAKIKQTREDGSKVTKTFVIKNDNGEVAKSEVVTIDGHTYTAKANGLLARQTIVKTKDGLVYANKNGHISHVKRVVRVGGKRYITKSDGTLYTNTWVTLGGKKYKTDKNGIIVESRKTKKR